MSCRLVKQPEDRCIDGAVGGQRLTPRLAAPTYKLSRRPSSFNRFVSQVSKDESDFANIL